ncbi:hypothetical protein [Luteipulveratus halotolerans]|uniref:Uncharacterized protein n=1 Tax=Luteipulveratus halotolerans TaxID=1631356 RepID=A0A0L6CPU5_9MICO|nr:hypothetical protein [Luteipulveratus halotolerans]KNX39680.1 hypothetical protein VV01_00130 [Luteipulveratus halotolerans]
MSLHYVGSIQQVHGPVDAVETCTCGGWRGPQCATPGGLRVHTRDSAGRRLVLRHVRPTSIRSEPDEQTPAPRIIKDLDELRRAMCGE